MSSTRRSLIIAICASILALSVVAAGISIQMSARNTEVRGKAANYKRLATTPVIGERKAYFPKSATNIEYWCRPYWDGINGSFDISENEYLDWTRTMNWQAKDVRSTDVPPVIRIMRSDGLDEYIHPKPSWTVYTYQTFDKTGYILRDFNIIYDKTEKRAYFTDSDGRSGPPSGN